MPITSPTASSHSSNRDSVPASPEISFAIPCYNERDNLVPLIDAIEREADRLGREYESWVKTLVSRCSNWIRSRVLQDPITDAGCTYRALRRECLDEVPFFRGVHRFLPILIALRGFRVVEVAVVNRDRRSGKSHYGVLDRAGAVIDMLAVRWMKTRMAPYQVVERWPRE